MSSVFGMDVYGANSMEEQLTLLLTVGQPLTESG